jgi:hypothetical protein
MASSMRMTGSSLGGLKFPGFGWIESLTMQIDPATPECG